jgi:hypothetical protein
VNSSAFRPFLEDSLEHVWTPGIQFLYYSNQGSFLYCSNQGSQPVQIPLHAALAVVVHFLLNIAAETHLPVPDFIKGLRSFQAKLS